MSLAAGGGRVMMVRPDGLVFSFVDMTVVWREVDGKCVDVVGR